MNRLRFLVAAALLAGTAVAQTTHWTIESAAPFTAPTLYPNVENATAIAIGSGSDVLLVDATGKAIWRADVGTNVAAPPTVADIDGDGKMEIILAAGRGEVVVLNHDGTARYRKNFDVAWAGGYESISAADVHAHAGVEIIFGTEDGWLRCMGADGTVIWQFYGDRFRTGPPAVGDVDGDGVAEIVYGTDNGHIYCLDGNGFTEWRYEEHAPYGRSAPLIADVNGDGAAEIYITQSNQGMTVCLIAIDGKMGKELWRTDDYQQSYVSNAIADFDGDGIYEILHTDKGNFIYCDNADGTRRWAADTINRGIFFTPAVADVDGDGALEVISGSRGSDEEDNTNLFVLSDTGEFEHRVRIGGDANSAPVAADLNNDGIVEIYAVSNRPNALHCMTFGEKPGAIAWASIRGDSAMTGSRVAMGGPAGAPGEYDADYMMLDGYCAYGEVTGDISWLNPFREVAFVEVTARDGDGRGVIQIVESSGKAAEAEFAMPWVREDAATITARVWIETADGAIENRIAKTAQAPIVTTGEEYHGWFQDEIIAKGESLGLSQTLLSQYANLLSDVVTGEDLRDGYLKLIPRLRREQELFAKIRYLSPFLNAAWTQGDAGSYFVWQDENPWDAHNTSELPSSPTETTIHITAFGNESESVAINFFNIKTESVAVRAQWYPVPDGLTRAPDDPPLADRITMRRAVATPDGLGGMVWDALPELDRSHTIQLPPGEAQQLWLTVSTKGLEPGTHGITLYLGSLEPNPTVREVPITIEVLPIALPDGGVPRMNWSRVTADTSEQKLQDMIDHGISVVYAPAPPRFTVDAEGNVIDEGDWSAFDAGLARLPGYFQVYLSGPPARQWPEDVNPEAGSERYGAGFRSAVKAFAAHMQSIGWGYDRWAFYPIDEPWLTGKRHLKHLRHFCEQVKMADPRARNYTDPTGAMKAEYLDGWENLIDVWQCEVNWLKRDPELRAWFQENAKEYLAYEATDPGKNLLPLGYYRAYGWIGAALGIEGYGWWVYGISDIWWPVGGWSVVYPSGGEVVSSRRWEAARDGLEDFKMLKLLREKAANADPHTAAQLLALHGEAVENVAGWQIGLIDEITRQTKDYETDWDMLKRYRQKIMEVLKN